MIKTSVIKTENGAVERAVQVRANDPGSPVDGQIWYNSTEKKFVIFRAGVQNVLNTRTVSVDPVSPTDGESWVNVTENTLKYHFGGSTFTIQLSATPVGGIQPAGDYLAVLTESELGQLSDGGIQFPNYLIDDYNTSKSNAVYTNASAQGSALRLNLGQNSGKVEYELETSTKADEMDGIMVISPRAVKPLSVVDNGDGTSTLLIYGDVTGLFANTKPVLIAKEITVDSQIRAIYLTDANGPAQLLVTTPAPSYNSGLNQTTVKVSNAGINILTQLACTADAIRMYPYDVKLEVGSDGIAGTLDNVPLNDAHGLDSIRTLGGDAFSLISQDLKESVTRVLVKKSPNKQYVLIACAHTLPGDVTEIVCYYSNDGLNTLARMPGGLETGYPGLMNTNDNQGGDTSIYLLDDAMKVGNNGKCIMGHMWGNPSGYYHTRMLYGDLTAPSPQMLPFAGFGAGPGIPYNGETNTHMVVDVAAADDNFDYVYVSYITFAHVCTEAWYKDGGATFVGQGDGWIDHYSSARADARWYNSLEGEKQLVVIFSNAGGPTLSMTKKRLSEFSSLTPAVQSAAFRTKVAFDGETRQDVFNGTEVGHVYIIGSSMDDDKIRLTCVTSSNGLNHLYTEINMLTPAPGVDEIQHIAFSAVPASGTYQLQFNLVNTANINFNDNALAVQTKLRAISTINGPNVNVTGNYTSGFDIEFVGTLKTSNQPQTIVFSNSLLDVGLAPVTITPSTTQPGVAPTGVTNNVAVYRDVGASDKVRLTKNGMGNDLVEMNPNYQTGGPSGARDGDTYAGAHKLKMDPLNPLRAFYAWPRNNTNGAFLEIEPMIAQIDNTSTFQGLFQLNDAGSNTNNLALRSDPSGTQSGDKVATLITFNRATTVRSIEVLAISTWANYAAAPSGFRAAQHHIRAKLVGVSGGLPDETNTLEISPTKYSPYETWADNQSRFFRFNTAVTNGQQAYLVLYTENFLPSTTWPFSGPGGGGIEYQFLGSTGAPLGAAYFRAGVWNATGTAFGIFNRIYDYFLDTAKTPDMMLYSRYFDMRTPTTYYGRVCEVQLEFKDNTNLLYSYSFGGDYRNDIDLCLVGKRIIARKFAIQALGTFVSGSTSEFLGADPNIDPNLIFQIRHGDPATQNHDRFGNAVFASGSDPLFPRRSVDFAAGTPMLAYNGVNQFKLNDATQGQQQDSDFKSGWCMRWNGNGRLYYYAGDYMGLKADNFTIEFEWKADQRDFDNQGVLLNYGTGYWYIQALNTGALQAIFGTVTGPALSNPTSTAQVNTFVAGTYYRVRVTRENDQLIHIYKWTHASPVWTEVSYSNQANMNNQYLTPVADYLYVGAYYSGSPTYGAIGEVKIELGTNTFLNGDTVIDQRPIYGHLNLGDRALAKRFLSNGATTGIGDNINYELSQAVSISPSQQSGLVAMRDQLLKYTQVDITDTGKVLAARVSLSRNSGSDAPAVQGILLNYTKKPV